MNHVSNLSIVFIVAFLILNIIAFLFIYRFLKKRIRMSFQPVLIGIASYMLFCYFGYALVAALINQNVAVTETLGNNAGLSLSILQVIRYLLELLSVIGGAWYVYRSYRHAQTEYHAGDMILFGMGLMFARYFDTSILPNITSLSMALAINQQGVDAVLASMKATDEATAEMMRQSLEMIVSTSPWEYFVDGFSSIFRLFVTIAASVTLYGIFKHEMPKKVILLSFFGVFGFYLIPTVEFAVVTDISCFINLIVQVLFTAITLVIAYILLKKYMDKELYVLTYTAQKVSEERIEKSSRSLSQMAAVPPVNTPDSEETNKETENSDVAIDKDTEKSDETDEKTSDEV